MKKRMPCFLLSLILPFLPSFAALAALKTIIDNNNVKAVNGRDFTVVCRVDDLARRVIKEVSPHLVLGGLEKRTEGQTDTHPEFEKQTTALQPYYEVIGSSITTPLGQR